MGRPHKNLGLGVAIGLTLASGAIRAQDVSGPATASDGDTLQMAGLTVRLHGIDAPERNQICKRGSAPWPCGMKAGERLAALISRRSVRCEQRDTDIYGRIVATCRVGSTDLWAELAEAGLAIALPQFSTFYVANEKRARDRRRGLWDSEFQLPSEYRAAHPPLARSRSTQRLRGCYREPARRASITAAAMKRVRQARRPSIKDNRDIGRKWTAITMGSRASRTEDDNSGRASPLHLPRSRTIQRATRKAQNFSM